jgi:arginine-tRNA-protein transferase
MRRVRRRNFDLRVEIDRPDPNPEKFELYCRYQSAHHDGTMPTDFESFASFLYDSPLESYEFLYYLGARLVGVSLADRVSDGLSSVYMFFDPEHDTRSLGTFSGLWEIDYCRKQGLIYYYLGYYVAESKTMSYKSRFRPNQILVADHRWVALRV